MDSSASAPDEPPLLVQKMPIQSTCGHWLRVGHLHAQKCFEQAFAGTGLTSIQFGALQTIAGYEGLGHQQLASHMRTAASVMTTALKPLSARNLITREPAKDDGRARLYRLTTAGRQLLTSCEKRLLDSEARLMQKLTPPERAELINLLERLTQSTV